LRTEEKDKSTHDMTAAAICGAVSLYI